MATSLRLEIPGGLYHVTSHGDRREDIYLSDTDRQRWLDLLGEGLIGVRLQLNLPVASVMRGYSYAAHYSKVPTAGQPKS